MTENERIEHRKEYQREWKQRNKDKVRQYKRNSAIRKAVNAINAGEVVIASRTVLVSKDERIEED